MLLWWKTSLSGEFSLSLFQCMSKPEVVYQTVAERHRWMLRFDPITSIDSFQVQRISPLTYDAKAKKWESVSIEFIEILENSMFMKLVDVAKNMEKQKPIVLEFLDGPGKGITSWCSRTMRSAK